MASLNGNFCQRNGDSPTKPEKNYSDEIKEHVCNICLKLYKPVYYRQSSEQTVLHQFSL